MPQTHPPRRVPHLGARFFARQGGGVPAVSRLLTPVSSAKAAASVTNSAAFKPL